MREFFVVIGVGGAFITLSVLSIVGADRHMRFPSERAAYEQLKVDSAAVGAASSEDVIGQVTATNQVIASQQQYNRMWWSGWATSDGWDELEPIPVPGE